MFSTDYLVICGRASARSIDPACATLESPLDSSNYHHHSTPLPCATLPDAGVPATASLSINPGSERNRPGYVNHRPPLSDKAGPLLVQLRVLCLGLLQHR